MRIPMEGSVNSVDGRAEVAPTPRKKRQPRPRGLLLLSALVAGCTLFGICKSQPVDNSSLKTNFSAQRQNGSVLLQAGTWSQRFDVIGGKFHLVLGVPNPSVLSDYRFIGPDVNVKDALLVPMFYAGSDKVPIHEFVEQGATKQQQVVFSTKALTEIDQSVSDKGSTVYYLVYSKTEQRIKGRVLLTDVDIKLRPGWNVVHVTLRTGWLAIGSDMNASPYMDPTIQVWDAPGSSGFWQPELAIWLPG